VRIQHNLATYSGSEAKVIDSSVIVCHELLLTLHLVVTSTCYRGDEHRKCLMSGDWIVTRHGSWSQEKAYVTGLEAANQ